MTREQLLRAVGDIRDDFIREAAPPAAAYRKRREFPWAGAVAACLALMIVGSTFFLSQRRPLAGGLPGGTGPDRRGNAAGHRGGLPLLRPAGGHRGDLGLPDLPGCGDRRGIQGLCPL